MSRAAQGLELFASQETALGKRLCARLVSLVLSARVRPRGTLVAKAATETDVGIRAPGLLARSPDGELFPVLAAEIPSRENGGLSPDGASVTWKLKRDVTWHDGRPFTADDCVFNWEYARDPATAAVTVATIRT
jgi:ABC-type transport system substrate-binding protein